MTRPPARYMREFWDNDWSLTLLLAFLVVAVFLARPLGELGVDLHLVAAVAFTIILVTGMVRARHSRTATVVFAVIGLSAAGIHWTRYANAGGVWLGIDAAASMIACAALATLVMIQVFGEGPITSQRLQGAVAAYLLIALMFAAAFTLIDERVANAFAGVGVRVEHDPMQSFVYFSFATLTTTGYGDITPVAAAARSMAMFEAVIGQIFPAVLLARLVSMELYYRQRRFEREQALLDRQELARELADVLRRQHPPEAAPADRRAD